LKKSRVQSLDNLKKQADALLPKLTSNDNAVAYDKNTLEKGCQVVSDYIKYLARMGFKKEEPHFEYGTHLKLSTWDFEKNKVYLNELLRKHKIDFQF
jgi:glutamine synthetase